MEHHSANRLLRYISLVALTPFMSGAIAPGQSLAERILNIHNHERTAVGVPPLEWDAGLAVSAQVWANHLAKDNKFEHAPENYDKPQGENIWAGSSGYFSVENMIGAWIAEKRVYKPGLIPENSKTGRFGDVGHYTQLIWRASTTVGCAEATGGGETILVCRYAQAGNYYGESPT